MTKKLSNIEVLNILSAITGEGSAFTDGNTKFSTKFAWNLRKNIKVLSDLGETVREAVREVEEKYSDDEYSIVTTDENGEEMRRVKEEFIEEFLNAKKDLYEQVNDVEIITVNIDEIGIDQISIDDLGRISFMIED